MTREERREANRRRIFEAAWQTVERDGAASVTIRQVATDVGYSAPVVYQHFANKEALLGEVMREGYAHLHAHLDAAAAASGPAGAIYAIGRAYLGFAERNPHLYRLMNGLAGVTLDPGARHAAAGPVIAVTNGAIEAWARATGVPLPDMALACDLVWGVVHGMTGLGQLDDIGFDRARLLADQALHALTLSWATKE
ncbi:TetR/AcrR family transcriptional regulator [Actinoplanes sp. NPDC051470]|uniref:TetR/AcrR family transcriptional regulator n=1 Tax=Actinoplanes sp. NPDC051470 TaxID=3157224 RepID=UPI00341383B6